MKAKSCGFLNVRIKPCACIRAGNWALRWRNGASVVVSLHVFSHIQYFRQNNQDVVPPKSLELRGALEKTQSYNSQDDFWKALSLRIPVLRGFQRKRVHVWWLFSGLKSTQNAGIASLMFVCSQCGIFQLGVIADIVLTRSQEKLGMCIEKNRKYTSTVQRNVIRIHIAKFDIKNRSSWHLRS